MYLKNTGLRVDSQRIQRPGSRGGRVVGYDKKGNPIYYVKTGSLSENEHKHAHFLNEAVIPLMRNLHKGDHPKPHDFTGAQPRGTGWRYEVKGTGIKVFHPKGFSKDMGKGGQAMDLALGKLGWHIAEKQSFDTFGKLMLRPLQGKPVKNVPSTIYHLAWEENKASIDKKGIQAREGIPKDEQSPFAFKYPKRAYFFKSFDVKEAGDMAGMIASAKDKTGKMVMYAVDTSKIPNHEFFHDPDSGGIYTGRDVPKEALQKIVWKGKA